MLNSSQQQFEQYRTEEIRKHLQRGEYDKAQVYLELPKDPQLFNYVTLKPLATICFEPFDETTFLSLPHSLQYFAFATQLISLQKAGKDRQPLLALLESLQRRALCDDWLCCLLAEQYMLNGEQDKARQLDIGQSHYALSIQGWWAFEDGDFEQALESFGQAIKTRSKQFRVRGQYLARLPGLYYLLTLLKLAIEKDNHHFLEFDKACQQLSKLPYGLYMELGSCRELKSFAQSLRETDSHYSPMATNQVFEFTVGFSSQVQLLVDLLCMHWSRLYIDESKLETLNRYFTQTKTQNISWFAQIAAQLLYHYGASDEASQYLQAHPPQGQDLLSLLAKKERWQLGLAQLVKLNRPSSESLSTRETRLVWWIDVRYPPHFFEAGIQKRGKKGWLKPSKIHLFELLTSLDTLDFLTSEDDKLIQLLKRSEQTNFNYKTPIYQLSGLAAIKAAIGHPLLFKSGDSKQPITIIEKPAELQISESKSAIQLTLPVLKHIKDIYSTEFALVAQQSHQFVLYHLDGVLMDIAQTVGFEGLRAPLSAKSQVLESIRAIAPLINIHSDISGIEHVDTGMKKLPPDQTLYLNIHNTGPGFQIKVQVQPLAEHGPTLTPGVGNSLIVEQIDGVRTQTLRDLKQEKTQVQKLTQLHPMFADMIEHTLTLDELEESLECLERLYQLQQSGEEPKIALQWQKGQPVRMTKTLGSSQMTVKTDKKQDWFSLQGELKVSKDEVLSIKQLLDALEHSQSRFIPIGEDTYLALTEELRRQMHMIASVSYREQFHPLAAAVIEQATDGMTFSGDAHFDAQLGLLHESFNITPKLPSTLQAELRDYQKDGYDWAMRLAHWGAGACLADDMGLGKTLQALAVILQRAPAGPSLVLCPTSVCFNWQDEARRFTPTLRPVLFGRLDKEQRKAVLDKAGPFDLIIISYGLLQTQSEKLKDIRWQTLVADEAQALKNPRAKRTLAACRLKAEFKLITTGTPVENNLTELWSLFNFINPGLLGSIQTFNKQFISKIESFDAKAYIRKAANQALRLRISPFILRRLKTDVLTELPPRTEIEVAVELDYEQTAFYEALRQKAVSTLLEKVKDEQPQQKRLRILAELMKLRRACCHPCLVPGGEQIPSSKLKVFDQLLDELLANNHKALVFSQFVGHLNLLRQHLTKKGVKFQYLDGSTPSGQRQKAVARFQSGEGELFLISLKAGGSGLNLTAADYVIHMDPWWNPAVEDQASDRAHRLGQTRPVTIYRLICRNTIEDKILSLHQRKRELADSLLKDSDGGGSLSVEELMGLLAPADTLDSCFT